MKKIIAILLAMASVATLAACDGQKEKETDPADPEVYMSQQLAYEAEQSKALEEKLQEEIKAQEEIDEYVAKVGKTKKKSQIVIQCQVPDYIGREYWKLEFKGDGKFKSKTEYHFLATKEQYEAKIKIAKDTDGFKLVDKDEDMRMVVIRNDKFNGRSFDTMYGIYSNETTAGMGYTIIE